MTTPTILIQEARAFCKAHGVAFSTLSRKLLGGGHDLARIEAGKRSIRWDTLARAREQLAAMDKQARAKRAANATPAQREAS